MIRVANTRHNMISGATAKLWLIRMEETLEGVQLRRYHELALQRQENPIFILTWTLFHVIDHTSALHGLTQADLARADAALLLTVTGHDDASSQQLYARTSYRDTDIRWRHRYVDIATVEQDSFLLDYGKFHDVVSEED